MSSATSKATRPVAGPWRVTLGLLKYTPVPYFVGRAWTALLSGSTGHRTPPGRWMAGLSSNTVQFRWPRYYVDG